ncbi:MAG: biotin-dependent carboxyltransferase family protein [Phycisphaeraceae bacterium]|nr:MAG: biotin-dependent carboxyltransferase family protein [Phycisphaeraceae bacterium]
MTHLRIVEPGMLTTVQDLGRIGHSAIGVTTAGAADPLSLRIGNRLLGNDDHDAALEITLIGGHFIPDADTIVCLTGADTTGSSIGDGETRRDLPAWTPMPVRAGESIRIGHCTTGTRAYLCIAGGIRTPPALGSRSTHIPSGIGGHEGRALKPGDTLPIGEQASHHIYSKPSQATIERIRAIHARRSLRITHGAHTLRFARDQLDRFEQSVYTMTEQSDRMGIRFRGTAITPPGDGHLRSEATTIGAIQVPHAGQPIVLFVDRPTTGGYPIIACIIAADLPALAQCRPQDELRFQFITRHHAVALLKEQEQIFDDLPRPTPIPTASETSR